MRLRLLVADAGRMWRTAREYRSLRRNPVRVDLGLGRLHAADLVLRAGRAARYRASVTDLGDSARPARLVLDFWVEEDGSRAARHLGYLEAGLTTRPRHPLAIEMEVDLAGGVAAWAEGRPLRCAWTSAERSASGRCAVSLSLRDGEREADRIVVQQRYEGRPA
jgi:hypothetical protein